MDRQTREELNALSKEVFGSSSRWQKLLTDGYSELVTEEVPETIPSEVEGEEPKTTMVRRPVLNAAGQKQSVTKRHTEDSIREYMLDLKKRREEIMAMIKKQQDEQAAAKARTELINKVNQEAFGSAGAK